jgi:hypothetical protein
LKPGLPSGLGTRAKTRISQANSIPFNAFGRDTSDFRDLESDTGTGAPAFVKIPDKCLAATASGVNAVLHDTGGPGGFQARGFNPAARAHQR